jgi:hypothetical protein
MDRIKVSDGDLIIMTVGGDTSTSNALTILREKIEQWADERGLQGCRVLVAGGVGAHGTDIKVLSVNNIFEDVVLKDGQ